MVRNKIIAMLVMDLIVVGLLTLGLVLMFTSTNAQAAPAMFALLLLTWAFAIVQTLPMLRAKKKSKFLLTISWFQVFLTPFNLFLNIAYLANKSYENDTSIEMQKGSA